MPEPEECDECRPVLEELKRLHLEAGLTSDIPQANSQRRTELWAWVHGHRRTKHPPTQS